MILPAFISEWPDALITDCVPASGLMGVNKVTRNREPATVAEREALQNAMGTQDRGANAEQLAAGIRKRYGLTVVAGSGWSTIAAALRDPMQGVAIFGSYQRLPIGLRQHGNQPSFDGGHCIYGQAVDATTGRAYIGDPLGFSYAVVAVAELQAYSQGLSQLFVAFRESVPVKLYGIAGWPDYARSSLANAQGYAYRTFVNARRAPATALPFRWGVTGWPLPIRFSYATASAYALRIYLNDPSYKP